MLVDTMSGAWEPRKFHDEYSEKLLKWIHERAKHPEKAAEPLPEPERDRSDVINLAEYLQKSLKARGVKSSGGGAPHKVSRRHKTTHRRKAG
jgi:DNA end-binding protein Ku